MLYEGIEVPTGQKSESQTIPAPVGGINQRDALANMEATDAYQLDNMYPDTSTVQVREGCTIHQPPVGNPVVSLEGYSGATSTKLLAFAAPNIWDVTVKNVKTNLKNTLVGDETVAIMFSTVADAAQFLIITTGRDTPMSYNGVVVANLAMTGFVNGDVASSINYVCSYKGRLYFGIKDRCGFYYLPPGQIQGALKWYDLGQVTRGGGFLQAITTYSQDAGDGPDDYIVFVTSRGECIGYTGTDPSDAAAWDLVGRFRSPEPIGRKCVLYYPGDVLLLTTEGVVQFSEIVRRGDLQDKLAALSGKLGDLLLHLNVNRTTPGWCMSLNAAKGMLIVSAPATADPSGRYYHFAMNTITKAWGRFYSDEWNGTCFFMAGGKVYFGRYDGSVRVIEGMYDNVSPIKFDCKQAYNYFKTPQRKQFHWAQFLVKSEAAVALSSRLSVDFVEVLPVIPPNPLGTGGGAQWDIAYWDQDYWGYGPYTQKWIAPYGDYGIAASHWLSGQVAGATFEWFSTEHVFEKAEGLL